MNRKIGMYASLVNIAAVLAFALCMLAGSNYGSYLVCIWIALSYLPLCCAFCHYTSPERKVAGYAAVGFACVYAVLILLVYFAQLTSVVNDRLNEQALQILDFQSFGLYFNYDLLGYGLMALSTFFAGLTIEAQTAADRWLRRLLLIHGIFLPACFIVPLLGVFHAQTSGADWIGTVLLEFWCIYFIPVGVLSSVHFFRKSRMLSEPQ